MSRDASDEPRRPEAPSPAFAEILRMTKRQLLDHSCASGQIVQTGAIQVGGDIEFPLDTRVFVSDEALIETFVVSSTGELTATGMDDEFIAAWTPAASEMTTVVRAALAQLDVELDGDAYLTVSTTPGDRVEGQCHFDDDLFVEDDGVGVVAIVGEIDGPRIAVGSIGHDAEMVGAPLPVSPQALLDFESGALPLQHTKARQIALLPQFAQLHAGPALAQSDPAAVRNLMVLRAGTKPRSVAT